MRLFISISPRDRGRPPRQSARLQLDIRENTAGATSGSDEPVARFRVLQAKKRGQGASSKAAWRQWVTHGPIAAGDRPNRVSVTRTVPARPTRGGISPDSACPAIPAHG